MPLKDFFWLNDKEFARRLSNPSTIDQDLMREDIHNCRTKHSGAISVTLGILEVPFTSGFSLINTGIGARRRIVAERRLATVHAELTRRGLPFHEQTLRDYLIPGTIAAIGFGIADFSVVAVDGFLPVPTVTVTDAAYQAMANSTVQAAQDTAGKILVEDITDDVLDKHHPHWKRNKHMKNGAKRIGSPSNRGDRWLL